MSHARIGMNSRNTCETARSLADVVRRRGLHLACAESDGILPAVMQARSPAALTLCQFRYPSPVRRLCADLRTPPTFLNFTEPCLFERRGVGYAVQLRQGVGARRDLRRSATDRHGPTKEAAGPWERCERRGDNNRSLFSPLPRLVCSGWCPERTCAIQAISALGSGGLFHVKSQIGQARSHARPRLARRDR